jgi:hypothetical protein
MKDGWPVSYDVEAVDTLVLPANARKADRAEAAFWRSAVWLPAEAARAADRPAAWAPTDATLPTGLETA